MHKPHGGRLINRVVPEQEKGRLIDYAKKQPTININQDLAQDINNIAHGVFSPLEGFLNRVDYQNVLHERRLANDLPWSIPIVLDISEDDASKIHEGEDVTLSFDGPPIALMTVDEKYRFDKKELAQQVFGTTDEDHPGVRKTYNMDDVLLGGTILLINEPELPFSRYALKPMETRILFKEKGWREVVGFQTRNVPHLGHEYLQKTALTFADGLFINPVIGKKKKGDFRDDVILRAYETLIDHYYLRERAVLVILPMEMRYAGPREAIFHAIVRKNFGCTHFIVGRDHAGVGNYYHPFAAQEIFEEFPDLGITPIFFNSFFYCKKCGGVSNEKTCPHDENFHIIFSGTRIREMLTQGKVPPKELMRPEVAEILLEQKKIFV